MLNSKELASQIIEVLNPHVWLKNNISYKSSREMNEATVVYGSMYDIKEKELKCIIEWFNKKNIFYNVRKEYDSRKESKNQSNNNEPSYVDVLNFMIIYIGDYEMYSQLELTESIRGKDFGDIPLFNIISSSLTNLRFVTYISSNNMILRSLSCDGYSQGHLVETQISIKEKKITSVSISRNFNLVKGFMDEQLKERIKKLAMIYPNYSFIVKYDK